MAQADPPSPRLLFISYAGKDAAFLSELETHLAPLARKRIIQPWHAGLVGVGQVWQQETALRLAQAEVILILVSPDYLAADSLYEGELAEALRRHEQGTARVIPVTLRPVHAAGATFTRLQAVPRDGRAVSLWENRDAAWVHIIDEVRRALADLPARPAPAAEQPDTLKAPPAGPAPPAEALPAAAPPVQAGADLGPGIVLCGKYRITAELGRGGMGRVLLAERDGIGGLVAVKVLLPEFSRSPEMARRFFNEARTVNAVRHPGLVQVFEHGQLGDGSTFLVMEYLEGESLGARLRRDPGCLREAAPQLGWQIATILGAVHARDIVHRDLKPDNVMMIRDTSLSGGERAKVLDFGIAKVARENSLAQSTRAGDLLGTPEYMSPEQCRDSGSVTDRTDVYALGVMLYQFLSGQVPFSDPNWMAVVTRQLTEAPLPIAQAAPGVDARLAELVQRMLDKDPLRRPSMAEVAGALQQAPGVPTERPPTRRTVVAGAVLGCAMLLGALLGIGRWGAGTGPAAPDLRPPTETSDVTADEIKARLRTAKEGRPPTETAPPIFMQRGADAAATPAVLPPIYEMRGDH